MKILFFLFAVLLIPASGFSQDLEAIGHGACRQGPAAFPGAEGWGKCATGWRNGRIIKVTNTNNTGAGSLRACLETDGPRVCMFDVGGTINANIPLDMASGVENLRGNVYIAGQSAPEDSGGIQIRLATSNTSESTMRILQSNHILIRHIRLRPGPGLTSTASVSGILVRNGFHIMMDNISVAYATDQNISTLAEAFSGLSPVRGIARYITIQDSITAFALYDSNHPNGTHSKGALLCAMSLGNFNGGDRCGYHSVIRTLFAHNNDRNPEFNSTGEPNDIVNNIMYNPFSANIELDDQISTGQFNIINNVAIAGGNTRVSPGVGSVFARDDVADPLIKNEMYLVGNINSQLRAASNGGLDTDVIDGNSADFVILDEPSNPGTGATLLAEDVQDAILPIVGATAPARDALDTITVNDVINGTGSRVNAPSDVTGTGLTDGYPTLATGTTPTDTDGDGMPDEWERAFPGGEFWVTRFDAWGDRDSDGWSNLEEYLNFRAGDIADPRI